MKKNTLVLTILSALSILCLTIQPAFAHVLQTNGTIGAVMHVDPDDDPIVGQPSYFFFIIKDKDNKFSFENCDCVGNIVEDEKVIFSTPLTKISTGADPGFNYTFSKKGDFEVRITGKALSSPEFKEFEIEYPLNISRTAKSSAPISGVRGFIQTHVIHLIGGLIVLGFFIFALARQRLNHGKTEKIDHGDGNDNKG